MIIKSIYKDQVDLSNLEWYLTMLDDPNYYSLVVRGLEQASSDSPRKKEYLEASIKLNHAKLIKKFT
jgi:hypothetical protein